MKANLTEKGIQGQGPGGLNAGTGASAALADLGVRPR